MWAGHVPQLATHVDSLGYGRLWCSEHYSEGQSASPMVLAAAAGCSSRTMRVGTAGVMLSVHSPFRVACDARSLVALFGNRIDVGVVSALPPPAARSALLGQPVAIDEGAFAGRVEPTTNESGRGNARSHRWPGSSMPGVGCSSCLGLSAPKIARAESAFVASTIAVCVGAAGTHAGVGHAPRRSVRGPSTGGGVRHLAGGGAVSVFDPHRCIGCCTTPTR